MFQTVLQGGGLTIQAGVFCAAASLVFGFLIALFYMAQGRYSKNFVITLTLMPLLIQMVMTMVNGNVGTGVAVLGAFSLVRFRSVPGSSREITGIFFSMAAGLATGMGYLTFGLFMVLIVGFTMLLLTKTNYGQQQGEEKELQITIPEDLEYTEVFQDIFEQYTKKAFLTKVKTTNMGSLFELSYEINLKDIKKEKQMIDAIRCRNGNLTVICTRRRTMVNEL